MAQMKVSHIKHQQRGNVTLVFALSGLAMIGMVGGGIEITRVVDGRGKLQAATDAAALAAAGMVDGSSNNDRETTATKVALANLRAGGSLMTSSLVIVPDFTQTDRVTLQAEAKIETILGQSMFGGFHTIKVSATAQKAIAGTLSTGGTSPTPTCSAQPVATDAPAQVLPPPPPPIVTPGIPSPAAKGCIWALGTGNTNGAITFNSGNDINAPTCQMHVHSTDNASIFHNGGNNITVDALYSKGPLVCNKPCTSNFEAKVPAKVLNDPYATGLPQLTAGSCVLGNNWTSFDNNTVNMTPGTYCGGINFNSGVKKINLSPGVYHIKGDWNINGAFVSAPGVTLYFEGNTNFQMNGNTTLNLSAPTTGPTAGLAMYEKYGLGQSTRAIDARGGMTITGVVYFPTKQLNFNAGNKVTSMSLQILARVIHFNDSDFNLTPYTGPLPPGFVLPGGTPATSVDQPAPPPVAIDSGLIVNGSFELPKLGNGARTDSGSLAASGGVPGWFGSGGFAIANGYQPPYPFWGGTDGIQFAQAWKNLAQTITLPANKTYRLEIDFQHSVKDTNEDFGFSINWDDKQLAFFEPTSAERASPKWKRVSFPISGSGSPVDLSFRQMAGGDMDDGVLIDRVRLVEDTTLTAAAAGCPGGLPALPPPPPTKGKNATPLRIIQ